MSVLQKKKGSKKLCTTKYVLMVFTYYLNNNINFSYCFLSAHKDFDKGNQSKPDNTYVVPALRKRKAPKHNAVEDEFDEFVRDFDSKNPNTNIQFKRNWAKGEIRKSIRLQGLPILNSVNWFFENFKTFPKPHQSYLFP